MKNAISVKYTLLCGTACCMASAVQAQRNVSDVSRMNVLFLMADDMRPELGCYGVEAVKTPNMDRLASSGVLFQNAYCNVPVSGASRASLLTGVYPHYPDRFVNFSAYASKDWSGRRYLFPDGLQRMVIIRFRMAKFFTT